MADHYEVIIIGGGPAGLNAALLLGRARRRVLLVDEGHHRNAASNGLHGFLTRDGVHPKELIRAAREQLEPYGVELRSGTVERAERRESGFEVELRAGGKEGADVLLLATGMKDRVPDHIPGFHERYGKSVFHCPYCDGWEVRDRALAVLGDGGEKSVEFALAVQNWSDDVVFFTDGRGRPAPDNAARLDRARIAIVEERITAFEGPGDKIERIVLATGRSVRREAMFFKLGLDQRSDLPRQLGVERSQEQGLITDEHGETSVPGVYAAGDASRDVELAIVAAAEGAVAAVAINKRLLREQLKRERR